MTLYRCFECGKEIKVEHLRKKVRCIYCGSKVLYKPRQTSTKVKAR
jgi:DNA-directed RNA polymerase subunit P